MNHPPVSLFPTTSPLCAFQTTITPVLKFQGWQMVKMLSGACAGYCVYCGENKTLAFKKRSKLFIQTK